MHYRISKIYHSTLKRAVRTSEYLLAARAAAARRKADGIQQRSDYEAGKCAGIPFTRGFCVFKDTVENGVDETVAAVTHNRMINQLYHAFFRLSTNADCFFYTGETRIHEWHLTGGTRRVIRANLFWSIPEIDYTQNAPIPVYKLIFRIILSQKREGNYAEKRIFQGTVF